MLPICRFDCQKQKMVTHLESYHWAYIDEWDQLGDLVYHNNQPHMNNNFQRYMACMLVQPGVSWRGSGLLRIMPS